MSISPSEFRKNNKQDKTNRQSQIIYGLLGFLFLITALVTTHYFRVSMMGLITFVLAYLSKGMRRRGKAQEEIER